MKHIRLLRLPFPISHFVVYVKHNLISSSAAEDARIFVMCVAHIRAHTAVGLL